MSSEPATEGQTPARRHPRRLGLGVVVVAFQQPESTLRCLRSIAGDPSPTERTVVVVDNSPPEDRGALRKRIRSATILERPENPGFGVGANLGVDHLKERAAGTYLGFVILNHDVELLPGFLGDAKAALADPEVGAASGPLFLDRAGGPLWYAGGGVRYLTGTVWQSHDPDDAEEERDVEFIPGSAVVVSAEAWDDVEGFDPRFFLYHEDLDLCRRLHRSGWRLRFRPGMRAVHHLGASTGSRDDSALYLENLARTRFLPWKSRLYRLYLAVLHTPYVIWRSVRIFWREGLRGGCPKVKALQRGHWEGVRRLWPS